MTSNTGEASTVTFCEKPIHLMEPEEVKAELQTLLTKHEFRRPARSAIDPNRPWREGVPTYDAADLAYLRGRTIVHAEGSLEDIVENAIKTWEMEATHFDFEHWTSVDHSAYTVSANGGKVYRGREAAAAGNYNWLMENADESLYNAKSETFDSSHSKFRTAFPGGFPFEVMKVFSGPPTISFSWRHWGDFHGEYKERDGDGKRYDLYGWGILEVDGGLKVRDIRIYYKPDDWLKALEGKMEPELLEKGASLIGSGAPVSKGCPFTQKTAKSEA